MAIQTKLLKCPQCNADISLNKEIAFCPYCGAKMLLHNDNEYIYRTINDAEIIRSNNEIKKMEIEREREIDERKHSMKVAAMGFALFLLCIALIFVIGSIGS